MKNVVLVVHGEEVRVFLGEGYRVGDLMAAGVIFEGDDDTRFFEKLEFKEGSGASAGDRHVGGLVAVVYRFVV